MNKIDKGLKIHSIIDVITNSSTEIYPFVSDCAEEDIFKMIDEILKVGNSNLRAHDLFTVEKVLGNTDVITEMFIDDHMNYSDKTIDIDELKGFAEKVHIDFNELLNIMNSIRECGDDYSSSLKIEHDQLFPFLSSTKEARAYFLDQHEDEYGSELIIKAKDSNKSTRNLFDDISNAVEYREVHC